MTVENERTEFEKNKPKTSMPVARRITLSSLERISLRARLRKHGVWG